MKLTEEQKQRFDWDGYLFFPSLFRPEEIKVLMDEVPALYAQRRPENVCEKTADVVRTNFAARQEPKSGRRAEADQPESAEAV